MLLPRRSPVGTNARLPAPLPHHDPAIHRCHPPPRQGGDLRAALSGDAADSLSWRRHGKQVAVDIAAGIAYLHSHNVMHRWGMLEWGQALRDSWPSGHRCWATRVEAHLPGTAAGSHVLAHACRPPPRCTCCPARTHCPARSVIVSLSLKQGPQVQKRAADRIASPRASRQGWRRGCRRAALGHTDVRCAVHAVVAMGAWL